MRCLLVEDEKARSDAVVPELRKRFDDVRVAEDRNGAMKAIEEAQYDLIVLDQRIPSLAGQFDADVIHGRAVFDHVRSVAPDTPVYFLTGLPMEDEYVDKLIDSAVKVDVWGDGNPVGLVQRFKKSTMSPFYESLDRIAITAKVTDEIEINSLGTNLGLSDEERRLLRAFTRQHGGVCVDVSPLGGGFSGSRVLKAIVKDGSGKQRLSVASKLGHFEKIDDEIRRYGNEVIRLPADAYATLIPGLSARVLANRGAFYRLLDGYDKSLFATLRASDASAASCIHAIRANETPWSSNHSARKISIGQIARLIVWEENLPKIHALLAGTDCESFERREVMAKFCTQHGDLHGENVLVNSKQRAMFIDYGGVGSLPSALDAVTIELSPFFHPAGDRSLLKWKAGDADIDWFDRGRFATLTTIPKYIGAARDWAHAVAFGEREVLACAYAYLLRQLQFDTTDVDVAKSLVKGIVASASRI